MPSSVQRSFARQRPYTDDSDDENAPAPERVVTTRTREQQDAADYEQISSVRYQGLEKQMYFVSSDGVHYQGLEQPIHFYSGDETTGGPTARAYYTFRGTTLFGGLHDARSAIRIANASAYVPAAPESVDGVAELARRCFREAPSTIRAQGRDSKNSDVLPVAEAFDQLAKSAALSVVRVVTTSTRDKPKRSEQIILPFDVVLKHILPCLGMAELHQLRQCSTAWREVCFEQLRRLHDWPKLRCFYTLTGGPAAGRRIIPPTKITSVGQSESSFLSFSDRRNDVDDLLGIGIQYVPVPRDKIELRTDFDVLSHAAFHKLNVRKSIFNTPFDAWLPLAVDRAHFSRVLPLLMDQLVFWNTGAMETRLRTHGSGKRAGATRNAVWGCEKGNSGPIGRSFAEQEQPLLQRGGGQQQGQGILDVTGSSAGRLCSSSTNKFGRKGKEQGRAAAAIGVSRYKPQNGAGRAGLGGNNSKGRFALLAESDSDSSLDEDDSSSDEESFATVQSVVNRPERCEILCEESESVMTPTMAGWTSESTSSASARSRSLKKVGEESVVLSVLDADDDDAASSWALVTKSTRGRGPTGKQSQSAVEVVHYDLNRDDLSQEHARAVLSTIPRLMNAQIVQIMKGDVHGSDKALAGYMGFHHLFLLLLEKFPVLRRQVEAQINNFIQGAARSKMDCPNLGEFFCLLAVSDRYSWSDVALPALEESFTRSAPRARRHFQAFESLSVSERVKAVFQVSVVDRSLQMFHRYFLENVAKPPHQHDPELAMGRAKGDEIFPEISRLCQDRDLVRDLRLGGGDRCCRRASCQLATYERSKGMPPPDLIAATQQFVRRVMEVDTWAESCALMGLERVMARESQDVELDAMAQFFDACYARSVALGYAGGGYVFGNGVRGVPPRIVGSVGPVLETVFGLNPNTVLSTWQLRFFMNIFYEDHGYHEAYKEKMLIEHFYGDFYYEDVDADYQFSSVQTRRLRSRLSPRRIPRKIFMRMDTIDFQHEDGYDRFS